MKRVDWEKAVDIALFALVVSCVITIIIVGISAGLVCVKYLLST